MTRTSVSACIPDMDDRDRLILKCNLWKFLKVLRSQNHPAYQIIAGTHETTVWIDAWSKENGEVCRKLSVLQFVQEQKSLPSRGFAYRMNFRIYTFRQQANESGLPTGESVWTATHRQHLTADIFPRLIAYICYRHIMNNATPFTLDTETIRRYNLAQKDVMALTPLIEQCNESLKKEMNNE